MNHDEFRTMTILLAEDDPDDRLMAKEAMEESGVRSTLQFAEDGEEVMDYLRGQGKFDSPGHRGFPGLILLDLNMPRKDGREVIREIRNDPQLRRIPIVVLSTSRAEEDISSAYDLGASSFICKPLEFGALVETLREVCHYWFEVSELPARPVSK